MDDAVLISMLVLLVGLLGHGYVWVAIVNRLHGWHGARILINRLTRLSMLAFVLLPAVVVVFLFTRGFAFFLPPAGIAAHAVAAYVWLCFFVGLGNLLVAVLGGYREDDPGALLEKSRVFAPLPETNPVGFAYQGRYGRVLGRLPLNESHTLAIEAKKLLIPQLAHELVGLRIAHISDLHVTGNMSERWCSWVAQQVNTHKADVIAITGDLLEVERVRPQLIAALRMLRARLGVYFILGNHDLYVDHQQTIEQLTAAGLVYVGDKQLELNWDGAEVLLVGNEFPWLKHGRQPRRGGPPEQFRFFLMHTPDQFDWAAVNEADLALAGHTHGGQVRLPLLGATACPSLYGTRFACGTFRLGRTVMHVSRGVCGENPIRWRCPPEVAILELTGGSGR